MRTYIGSDPANAREEKLTNNLKQNASSITENNKHSATNASLAAGFTHTIDSQGIKNKFSSCIETNFKF